MTNDLDMIFEKAMEGDTDARCELASRFARGNGVEQSYAKAHLWWQLAAEQGCAEAETSIGLLHENGDGVKQSFAKALRSKRR